MADPTGRPSHALTRAPAACISKGDARERTAPEFPPIMRLCKFGTPSDPRPRVGEYLDDHIRPIGPPRGPPCPTSSTRPSLADRPGRTRASDGAGRGHGPRSPRPPCSPRSTPRKSGARASLTSGARKARQGGVGIEAGRSRPRLSRPTRPGLFSKATPSPVVGPGAGDPGPPGHEMVRPRSRN